MLRGRLIDWQTLMSFKNWFPVTISEEAGQALVWWRFMGAARFEAAFFQDSLATQPSAERLVCKTPLSALADICQSFVDSVPPTAFVFHVSRCGSTLLTQMLAALPSCVVMSEPPVLDAFFRLHHAWPEQSGGRHTLKLLLAALGQRRSAQEQHFFVKLDSWHTPWMAFVREVFPALPVVFLYRQPEEVLASHRRQRGQQMVPGLLDTSRLLPDLAGVAAADLDAYAVRVLEAIFASAATPAEARQFTLLNYSQLPDIVWTELLPWWGICPDAAQHTALLDRAGFHSKHGGMKFEGDSKPLLAGLAQNHEMLARLYAQLEKKRLGDEAPGRMG